MPVADLEGTVAIVTGAAMGIGRACALVMAARGARVFIADIDVGAGEATRAEIETIGGVAHFVRTDVTSLADFETLAHDAVERYQRIDILVNNAAQAIGGVVDEIDEATWNRVISTNLTSVWRGMKACVPEMRKQGKGSVVNMSSVQSLAGFKRMGGLRRHEGRHQRLNPAGGRRSCAGRHSGQRRCARHDHDAAERKSVP